MRRDDVDSQRLGVILRERRQNKGLSQNTLGKRFGLSGGSIGWLERGDTKRLSEDKVKEILSFLEIDFAEFVRGERKPSPDRARKGADASRKPLKHPSPGVKESGASGEEERREHYSVTARVTGEMYKKIREYEGIRELSMGDVLRMALEKFFSEAELSKEVSARIDIMPSAPADLSVKNQEAPEKKSESLYEVYDDEERECLDELRGEDEEEESVSVEEITMLLKGGHGYNEIGELLGMTPEQVKQALLGEHRAKREKRRKGLVEEELSKLDVLQKALWEKACSRSYQAVELTLKIMGLRAKLLGIDREGGGSQSI